LENTTIDRILIVDDTLANIMIAIRVENESVMSLAGSNPAPSAGIFHPNPRDAAK